MEKATVEKSDRSFWATALFAFFLGYFGVHRFYVGKIGTGVLMILTLGGFGIWYTIDLILIACNLFKDKNGRLISWK
ncbi:MAG: TM2 domain-containing protein [Bdellovibrionota bacterium]